MGIQGVTDQRYGVSFWGDENVPKIDRGGGYRYLWI